MATSSKLRMSGLISGMDTESVVSALVSSRKTKVEKAQKEQTLLGWKQDLFTDLNKELKSLQSKFVASMRFSTAYSAKKTTVSDTSVASVIAGSGATNSVQSLKVTQLAKTGYLTGGKISATDSAGNETTATALSKLSDLGFEGSGSFSLTTGGKTTTIDVTENTSISDVLTQMKNAGLNASFDEKNQRFFISSKTSGEAADFTLTSDNYDGNNALAKLGLQSSSYYEKLGALQGGSLVNYAKQAVEDRKAAYASQAETLRGKQSENLAKLQELNEKYELSSGSGFDDTLTELQSRADGIQAQIDAKKEAEGEDADVSELQKQLDELNSSISSVEKMRTEDAGYTDQIAELENKIGSTEYNEDVLNEFRAIRNNAQKLAADTENQAFASKIDGQDSIIYLNGAKFTNSTNVHEINGLTITATNTTGKNADGTDREVTLTTTNDTSNVYKTIKDFLTQYNTVINKIDSLYNGKKASSDYSPLTDEEKEAMSESEVEKYEQKIKDGLLHGDSTLSSISQALTKVMSAGIEVGGKTLYLSDFGIKTLAYFDAADNEKHAFHIDGDADDSSTAGNDDKLASMISANPDTVVSFFTKLSQSLYESMTNLSKSNDYRTYGTFFDDKKMKSDYESYNSKISDLEQKMNDYEDKMYRKFSKMETALAKMQSATSSITALLGG